MVKQALDVKKFEFLPLNPGHWDDFETLFGPNGACAGCWCMWFRMANKEFGKSGKEGHRNAMRTLVQSGVQPGLIAYADGIPAGWVAIAPRSEYVRLETAKVLAPVDDLPVWSVTCFFIHKKYRKLGLMEKLLVAAVAFAREKGATTIEAYPYDGTEKMTALSIYTGVASTFRRIGFVEVERRSESRPIMRLKVS